MNFFKALISIRYSPNKLKALGNQIWQIFGTQNISKNMRMKKKTTN
jgi:hypothetical protein